MNIWAKISSLVIIYFLIFGIYYTIKILFLSMRTPFWVIFLPFTWLLMIGFYSPLFYYGWVKKPKNKEIKVWMKFWARGLTIIFPILAVISFIGPWGLELTDIPSIIPMFLVIVPLYYYGWRD